MESTVWICDRPADDLLNWIHGQMVAARHVESVTRSSPTTLEVSAAAMPAWAPFIAILLFPIGLLALFAKTRRLLRFWAEPMDDGTTRLHVDGALVPGTQKALVALYNDLNAAGTVLAVAA